MKKKRSFCYKVAHLVLSIFYKKRQFIGLENLTDQPHIIVGNHAQVHGPLVSEVQMPLKRKTWCIANVMTAKDFAQHAKVDFWPFKPKWCRWFYNMLAHIIAPIGASIFNSCEVIPVYHDGRLMGTFKSTIKELEQGNNIVIFPECYTPHNNIVNDFQDKFVDVARLYYKKYGKCLSFVPMYNAVRLKKVLFGAPIAYNPDITIEENRKVIIDYLKQEITNLALSLPPHEVVQYANKGRKNNPMSK